MKCFFVHLKIYQQKIKTQRQLENNVGLIHQTSFKVLTTLFYLAEDSVSFKPPTSIPNERIFFHFLFVSVLVCFVFYVTTSSTLQKIDRQICRKKKLKGHFASSIYSPFICDSYMSNNFC